MNCPKCNAELPEQGAFCPMCAVQVRCLLCTEALLPGARACVACGTLVGEGRNANGAAHNGGAAVNKILLEETSKKRALRAELSDTAMETLGQGLGMVIARRLGGHSIREQAPAAQEVQFSLPGMAQSGEPPQGIEAQEHTTQPLATEAQAVAGERVPARIDDVEALLSEIDSTSHPEVSQCARALDRALHVLRIAKDRHGIDGMTPSQIAKVLTEKFRVSATRTGVGSALSGAPELVNRQPAPRRGFVYRLMAAGVAYLEDASPQPSRGASQRRASRRRRTQPGTRLAAGEQNAAAKERAEEQPSRREGRRPGTKALLLDLLAQGFFKTPRTVGDVQRHLAEGGGHRLGTNELSTPLVRLVRDKALRRSRRDDGQFEYTSE